MSNDQIEKAARALHDAGVELGPEIEPYMGAARAVIAAIHPTVSTRDQLGEACIPGAVVIDSHGLAWQADTEGEGWIAAVREMPERDLPLPATVIHLGGAA